jgi:hypothetical protein
MSDDEDWVMRPALEGVCRYESLIDGTLDLADVERINEALDVRAENYARYEEAARNT